LAWCWTASADTFDIYFIAVEGGQSTLIVAPTGQSFLIDTGYTGDGKPQKAGDPTKARDANRILAAARDTGIRQIDYLMITHFHNDHDGSVAELSQLRPIRTYVDHGSPSPDADHTVPGSLNYFDAYAAVRDKGKHLEPESGDQLRLKGLNVTVVSAAQATLVKPLKGAGRNNVACGASGRPAQEPNENPRSTGILMQFGRFRFLDAGDLTGPPLFALVCPKDMIGPVDVYLVAHHGGAARGPSILGIRKFLQDRL
jgi:competence protein ComEC